MRPRVLQVIDQLGLGGAQSFLRDLAKALDARGNYQPIVCCLTERTSLSSEFETAGIRLVHLNTKRRNPVDIARVPFRLARVMRQYQVHLVHTHLFASNGMGRIAGRWASLPVVIHEHSNRSLVSSYYERVVDRALASWAAAVVVVSHTTRDFNVRRKRVPPAKIHVVLNGLDLDRLDAARVDRERMRMMLGVLPDAPLVIGVGRLERSKRFDVWLKAAARVLGQRPDARFLIVGDGSLRTQLEAQAVELRLEEAVHFTGPRQDIPDLLDASDLFVLSSDWEGLPLTLLEALAMGLPSIATAVDGSVEVLQGLGAGCLVPPGQADVLATTILGLLGDKDKAQALGRAGRMRVEENHCISRVVRQVEAVYDQVLLK